MSTPLRQVNTADRDLQLVQANVSAALNQVAQSIATSGVTENEIRVQQTNGTGSINTGVQRWVNNPASTGSAISYTDSATLGGSFTIKEAGIYTISSTNNGLAANTYWAITVNSTALLAANLSSAILNFVRAACVDSGGNTAAFCSWTGALAVNDVVRLQTGATTNGSQPFLQTFTITKVSNLTP